MNEENIADVHAEVDGPGMSCLTQVVFLQIRCQEKRTTSILALFKTDTLLCTPVAVDTPFFGGVFKMKLVLPSDYPHTPPKGKFPSLKVTTGVAICWKRRTC